MFSYKFGLIILVWGWLGTWQITALSSEVISSPHLYSDTQTEYRYLPFSANAGGTPGTQEIPGLPDSQPSTSSGIKYVQWPTTLQDMASPDNPPKIFAVNGEEIEVKMLWSNTKTHEDSIGQPDELSTNRILNLQKTEDLWNSAIEGHRHQDATCSGRLTWDIASRETMGSSMEGESDWLVDLRVKCINCMWKLKQGVPDSSLRPSTQFQECFKIYVRNTDKIKQALGKVRKALMWCYRGDHAKCRDGGSFVCGTWTNSYIPPGLVINPSKDDIKTIE